MSRCGAVALVMLGTLVPGSAAADESANPRAGVPALTAEEQQQFADAVWEADPDFLSGADPSKTAAVPEPGTLALLGVGLAALGFRRRNRARR